MSEIDNDNWGEKRRLDEAHAAIRFCRIDPDMWQSISKSSDYDFLAQMLQQSLRKQSSAWRNLAISLLLSRVVVAVGLLIGFFIALSPCVLLVLWSKTTLAYVIGQVLFLFVLVLMVTHPTLNRIMELWLEREREWRDAWQWFGNHVSMLRYRMEMIDRRK